MNSDEGTIFILGLMNCQFKKIGKEEICKNEDRLLCLSKLEGSHLVIFNQYVNSYFNACYYLMLLKLEERNFESIMNLTNFTKQIEINV